MLASRKMMLALRLHRSPSVLVATVGVGLALGAVGGSTRTTAASQPPPPTGGGAYGDVTAGPTCPVERPDQPCPPRPVAAQVNAQDGSGRTVATTRTDQAGRYGLSMAAGTYTLVTVTGATYPRCPPTSVTVRPAGRTRADINCDTGIR